MMKTYKILFSFFLILMSGFGFSQSVPSYVPTNGLVGWWGFNGNAQDGSGNGNHGTVNGATLTTDRFGNQNSAYDFDGVDDYVVSPFVLNSDYTISIWVYALNNNNGVIFNSIPHNFLGYSSNAWWLGPGNMGFLYGNGVHWLNNSHGFTNPLPYLSNWVQHTVVKTGNNWKFFLNSVLVYDYLPSILQSGIPSHLVFGRCDPSVCIEAFTGKLDDIGIWNRALTQQEITNLYNSQLPTQTSLCLPTITTTPPSSVVVDSVVIGGDISNDGGSTIVLRGVCYSTSPNPNMGNQRTEDGSGTGSFNTVLRGLNPSTTYYARSYAKNSNGVVVYGNEVSFTTGVPAPSFSCGTSTVSDLDNNIYNTVQIGNQCWTQSNLKVSKYRNGDNIPTGLSNSVWFNTTSGAYAIYNNDPVKDGLYGKLYNNYAVTDSRGLCPSGWHVPSDEEWNVLVKYLDPNADTVCGNCWQSPIAGGALKSTAMQPTPGGWNSPNYGATNSSGFTALPGGLRTDNGHFVHMTDFGCWWSSSVFSGSSAWDRFLDYGNGYISRNNNNRTNGFSVRCCRD